MATITERLISFVKSIGFSGAVDILIMTILIYALIIWFKRSKAVFVLTGLFIVGVVYNAARELNLQLLAAMFRGFFTVILIAIIVIFQEEIKHMFERVAMWSLNRRLTRQKVLHLSRNEVEMLVRSLTDLAHEKIGALVVIKGKDAIVRHINGGWDLNGEMSEPVIKSLFDPHSIGHDGAVIIENNRLLQFGCHLPLSKDLKKIPTGGGTRHAAALGLSELTDALCLVVSEERGTISVAQDGELEIVPDPERLNLLLERFYDETNPTSVPESGLEFFTKNVREKVIAFLLTLTLWFFYVHEGRLTYRTFWVPVDTTNVSANLNVTEVRPTMVEVTLSGPRRYFYFTKPGRMKAVLNLVNQEPGTQIKTIQKSNVVYPDRLVFESVSPNHVRVVLTPKQ